MTVEDRVGGRLLLVSCGGTISSIAGGKTGGPGPVAPRLGAAELSAAIPELAAVAEVDPVTFSTLPSSHLHLDDVLALHRLIVATVDSGAGHIGVVVSIGTDTLEEVAWALDLLWDHDLPLVVTGALRNPTLPGADGPANLVAAAVVAVSREAQGCGVLVVMNDQIHLAAHVRKSHTGNVASFVSPNTGPIGWVSESVARILLRPAFRRTLDVVPVSTEGSPVALIAVSLGEDGRLLDAVESCGYHGVVIDSFGGGHLPLHLVTSAGFEQLLGTRPVVVVSRCWSGELLRSTYDFAGSEIDLASRGVIPGGALDGPRARILLSLLLSGGVEPGAVADAFALPVALR